MPQIKAISIKDPHASDIMRGEKTIEYRTWTTDYRGPLLICASKTPKTINSGKALCKVILKDIVKNGKIYNWILEDPKIVAPIPVKGQLGLFSVQI